MMREIDRGRRRRRFHLYVLSDTSDRRHRRARETRASRRSRRNGGTHSRSPTAAATVNTGFKAGNIWDFCERWGGQHEFAVTLDADSFMTAAAILRLVRIMQADPKLGILQGLVVGLPSTSAFARIFQFGMRLGMRSYTIGSAWWQADCGPYWGHNAIMRLAPFIAHCRIPVLPDGGVLGGHVLSHDQIEAVLMRRAGYDVRVLPEEDLGWEENPPTLIEFIRRDLRWCQGNMQYGYFLFMPGLKLVSRFQLAFAMLMFLGSPAWIGLLVVGTLALAAAPTPADFIRPDAGHALLAIILVMWFAPKIATVIDVLPRPKLRRAFGGTAAVPRQRRGRDDVLHPAVADHVVLPHAVPRRPAVRPRDRLGRPGARRSRRAVVAVAASVVAAHRARLCLARPHRRHPSVAHSVRVPARRRARAFDPARRDHRAARGWPLLTRLGIGRLPEETAPPRALTALALPALTAAARPA